MSDTKELLERARRQFPPPGDVMDALVRRRDRKRRNRRVGSAVIAVIAATAAAIGLGEAFGGGHPRVPATPTPSPMTAYHHNGDIAVYGMVGSYDRPCARSASEPTEAPVRHGCAIFEVDPATGHEVPLPIGGIGVPGRIVPTALTWSPDGMELAYSLEGEVAIFDVSTGRSQDIMRCPPYRCDLAWSPDGGTIAVSHGDAIDLVTPDGDKLTSLEPLGPGTHIGAPSWLPDGRWIAFVVGGSGLYQGGSGLYEVDRTGAHLRHLGDIPKGADWPGFSPDGSRIAYFLRQCGDSVSDCDITVTVAPTDGSSPGDVRVVGGCWCIIDTPGLGWSPDGKKLALVVPEPSASALTNADGIELVLVSVEGAYADPAWRPVP